eukprot:c25598_g2_i1 orf=500-2077(-)
MAFRTFADELSIPHFPGNLLGTGAGRFSERTSFQPDHERLHRMLRKAPANVLELSECDLSQSTGTGLKSSNDLPSLHSCHDKKDTKELDDKISLLNEGADSVKLGGPTWLNTAVMRQHHASSFVEGEESRKWCGCEPGSQCVQCSFLHLQTEPPAVASNSNVANTVSCTQWLGAPMAMVNRGQQSAKAAAARTELIGEDGPSESIMGMSTQHSPGSADNINPYAAQRRGLLDLHSDTANSSDLVDGDAVEHENRNMWQNVRLKGDILSHPLYEQLLAAHVSCLRIATPVDQLPRIDAQLTQSQHVLAKYSVLGQNHLPVGEEKDELDQFMTHYVLLLCSFKEQLQQHVRVHAMEAVMACWELEQSLLSLTGISPGDGTGATMSDDDDEQEDSDPCLFDTGLESHDAGGFGPLIPTETERSLMERVRQELKNDLKQGYRNRIVDVREEILRKRRAGKLPGDTTSVLKTWWHAHSKWPYPTEDEKARLVQETGLQLKQINNWFINQRKRNWHTNPSSTSNLKSKRKR